MALGVKICGLTQPADLACACEAGAALTGFIFYPPSPRCLTPDAWRELAAHRDLAVPAVGVMVDAADDWIEAVMAAAPLDYIQLHGSETPERAAAVAARFGCGVIKAISVRDSGDVDRWRAFDGVADMFLFDAKPPRQPGAIPGGNGLPFDWRMLVGRTPPGRWLLAGGISAENMETAARLTGAPMVDLSSSIETAPGRKDLRKMRLLLARAAGIGQAAEEDTHASQ